MKLLNEGILQEIVKEICGIFRKFGLTDQEAHIVLTEMLGISENVIDTATKAAIINNFDKIATK